MKEDTPISFGDHVRIRRDTDTEVAGFAGQLGEVLGVTTPSITDVEVIGRSDSDSAFNVYVETLNRDAWFGREMLEFVDHGPGRIITIEGVPTQWTRTSDGDWVESPRRRSVREWLLRLWSALQ